MLEKNEIPKQVDYEADTMHCGKVFGHEPSEHELMIEYKRKQLLFAQDLLVTNLVLCKENVKIFRVICLCSPNKRKRI